MDATTIFIAGLLYSSNWSLTTGYQNQNLFYNITNIKTLWKENLTEAANCKVARIKLSSLDQLKSLLKKKRERKTFTAWTEIVTQWVSVQGCYLGYYKKTSNNPLNPKASAFSKVLCLSQCNFTAFVIVKQSCVCLSQVQIFKKNECSTNNFSLVKENTTEACLRRSKKIGECQCMCLYQLSSLEEIGNSGNCKTFTFSDNYSQPIFDKANCKSKYPYLTQTTSQEFELQPKPETWLNAIDKSQSEGVSMLKYDSLKQYKSNISKVIDLHTKYWIGSYQKYFKVQIRQSNECLAVEARRLNINVKYKPCSKKLPVLCQTSIPFEYTSISTVTVDHNVTLNYSDHSNGNVSPVDLIIVIATIGTITLFMIIITGVCFLKRKANTINGLAARDEKQSKFQNSAVDGEERRYEMCTTRSFEALSSIPYVDIDIDEYSSFNVKGANVNISPGLNDYDSMAKIRTETEGEYGRVVKKTDLSNYDSMAKIRSETEAECEMIVNKIDLTDSDCTVNKIK